MKGQALEDYSSPNDYYYYQRAFIGISGGFSLPRGGFSAANNDIGNSAYADNGWNIHYIDAGYRIGKTLGVSFSYFVHQNDLNERELLASLAGDKDYRFLSANAGEYELKGIMLGLFVCKTSNSLDLDLLFQFGYANFYVPDINIKWQERSTGETGNLKYVPTAKNTFGAGISAGLRIHLNTYLDFVSRINYSIFENSFTQRVEGIAGAAPVNTNLTYQVLGINFGIAYRFINDNTKREL